MPASRFYHVLIPVFITLSFLTPPLTAGQNPTREGVEVIATGKFSPYAGRNFPTRAFFGDTHLHTAVSVDAGTMCRVGQEDAFRFARGEEITTTHGLRAKLSRPLDFLVVSDHAEMYGLMPQLLSGDPELLTSDIGKRWYGELQSGDGDRIFTTAMEIVHSLQKKNPPIESEKLVRNAWHAYTELADRYNEPGRFTALIGYEWTAIGGFNLHRNVIFRGDSSVAKRTVPFSQFDSQNPEDLWRHLSAVEQATGAELLAIPHNGNLSNGRMFKVESFDRKPLNRELAALRARFEKLVEVTQIKGDGETHPMLSPNDEFADYETWDRSNLDGTEVKRPDMLQWEYAREALKTGLKLEKKLGVNPFKFGMIGSTDRHIQPWQPLKRRTSLANTRVWSQNKHRWEHVVIEAPNPEYTIMGWQQAASGYAAVWATENTRGGYF